MTTIYYLDSSAWVKRYFREPGTDYIRALFGRREPFACCVLGYIEVTAAIARRIPQKQQQILRQNMFADWKEMVYVDFDDHLIGLATELAWGYKLRGADSIHLAAAQQVKIALGSQASLMLITSDQELLTAAAMIQIAVVDPTNVAAS